MRLELPCGVVLALVVIVGAVVLVVMLAAGQALLSALGLGG
jgi:hypothetical protein